MHVNLVRLLRAVAARCRIPARYGQSQDYREYYTFFRADSASPCDIEIYDVGENAALHVRWFDGWHRQFVAVAGFCEFYGVQVNPERLSEELYADYASTKANTPKLP